MSCAIEIISFQNFSEVLKTCSACRKDFFDKLRRLQPSWRRLSICPEPGESPGAPEARAQMGNMVMTTGTQTRPRITRFTMPALKTVFRL